MLVDKTLKEVNKSCPITVSQSAWPVIDRTISEMVDVRAATHISPKNATLVSVGLNMCRNTAASKTPIFDENDFIMRQKYKKNAYAITVQANF